MTTRLTSAALLCAATFAALPALASSSATATLDQLTFTLYDLNPDDGIAPSFRFLSNLDATGVTGNSTTSASASDSTNAESGTDSLTRGQAFLPHVSDINLTNALAVATVQPYAVAAHGQAAGPSTQFSATGSTTSGANGGYYNQLPNGGIEVSANTLLVVRGLANASASVSASTCNNYYYYCGNTEAASSTVTLGLSFNATDGSTSGSGTFSSQLNAATNSNGTSTYQYDPVTGYGQYVYTSLPSDVVKSQWLSVAFTNNTTLTQRGTFSMSAAVNGSGYTGSGVGPVPISTTLDGAAGKTFQVLETTPDYITYGLAASVPEPQTWLTMFAGLVGISFVARRARQA